MENKKPDDHKKENADTHKENIVRNPFNEKKLDRNGMNKLERDGFRNVRKFKNMCVLGLSVFIIYELACFANKKEKAYLEKEINCV
jgi:hypothetical protein